ncbi:MAG: class I tRNA ligase family protein, partial [Opitutales bacterium]
MSERAGEQAGGPPDPVSRWEEQEREELADCRVFSVQRRRFRHPRRGVEADFFVVQPADWAVAMGRTAEGAWLMVRQFRYGTQSRGWEFPSGCCGPGEDPLAAAVQDVEPPEEALRILHRCIADVTDRTEKLLFNTAISAMMEFVKAMQQQPVRPRSVLRQFVLLLAPYAPHLGEELWRK